MTANLYLEGEFWALVGASLMAPLAVFVWLIRRRKLSRVSVAAVAVGLVVLSGLDAILLQRLAVKARQTPGLSDDRLFASEFSLALYVLPLITAGIGINLLTHVLNQHLIIAELEYDLERRRERAGRGTSGAGGGGGPGGPAAPAGGAPRG